MTDAGHGETSQQEAPGQQSANQGNQQELAQQEQFLQALNAKFAEYDQKLAGDNEDKETLQKLKQAFGKQEEPKQNQKWIDKHLSTILEARQKGQQMPITEDLVVELQKQMDETSQLKADLLKAQQALQRMQNPETWQDNQIYSDMDNTLSGVLEKVYGQEHPQMHQHVSGMIADRLKQVRSQAPDVWSKIRNDKTLQRKIVMKAVADIVPPQAMQMMRQQHEENQPITPELLNQAWEETRQIEDPELRAKAKELLRQKLFSMRSPVRARGA